MCLYESTCICRCESDLWAFVCFCHNSLSLNGSLVLCVKEKLSVSSGANERVESEEGRDIIEVLTGFI